MSKELKVAEKQTKGLQTELEVLALTCDKQRVEFSDLAYNGKRRKKLQQAQDTQDDIEAMKLEYEELKIERASMIQRIQDGDAWCVCVCGVCLYRIVVAQIPCFDVVPDKLTPITPHMLSLSHL